MNKKILTLPVEVFEKISAGTFGLYLRETFKSIGVSHKLADQPSDKFLSNLNDLEGPTKEEKWVKSCFFWELPSEDMFKYSNMLKKALTEYPEGFVLHPTGEFVKEGYAVPHEWLYSIEGATMRAARSLESGYSLMMYRDEETGDVLVATVYLFPKEHINEANERAFSVENEVVVDISTMKNVYEQPEF